MFYFPSSLVYLQKKHENGEACLKKATRTGLMKEYVYECNRWRRGTSEIGQFTCNRKWCWWWWWYSRLCNSTKCEFCLYNEQWLVCCSNTLTMHRWWVCLVALIPWRSSTPQNPRETTLKPLFVQLYRFTCAKRQKEMSCSFLQDKRSVKLPS